MIYPLFTGCMLHADEGKTRHFHMKALKVQKDANHKIGCLPCPCKGPFRGPKIQSITSELLQMFNSKLG